jgi:hypothetical protein
MAQPRPREPTTADRLLLAATSIVALVLLVALIVELTRSAS